MIAQNYLTLFVEDYPGVKPYIVQDDVVCSQNEDLIFGEYNCKTYDRKIFKLKGKISVSTISGNFYAVESEQSHIGLGFFQLKILRSSDLLDGFCVWNDYDTNNVECSRHIWINKESIYFKENMRIANELMENEIEIFILRRKLNRNTMNPAGELFKAPWDKK